MVTSAQDLRLRDLIRQGVPLSSALAFSDTVTFDPATGQLSGEYLPYDVGKIGRAHV